MSRQLSRTRRGGRQRRGHHGRSRREGSRKPHRALVCLTLGYCRRVPSQTESSRRLVGTHAATIGPPVPRLPATSRTTRARFYSALAEDSIGQLSSYPDLAGAIVLDVGGGPGYFRDAFTTAGAAYFALDADVGELSGLGQIVTGTVIGDGHESSVPRRLPSTSATPRTCSSTCPTRGGWPTRCCGSPGPAASLFISYTVWFGPWGGHETSPWHYLGGALARRRYARRHGHEPKNKYGESLFRRDRPRRAALGAHAAAPRSSHVLPRYNPRWTLLAAQGPAGPRGGDVEPRAGAAQVAEPDGSADPVPHSARCRLRSSCRARVRPVARVSWSPTPSSTWRSRRPGSCPGDAPVGRRGRLRPAAEPGLRLPVADGPVLLARVCARRPRVGGAAALAGAGHGASRFLGRGPAGASRSACAPTSPAWWRASPSRCHRGCSPRSARSRSRPGRARWRPGSCCRS